MLAIQDPGLPIHTLTLLADYQRKVTAVGSYSERVAIAAGLFSTHNKPKDKAFKVVRATLDAMCRGPRRCMYCEDSVADEVEHFAPKNLYPDRVFDWTNYCYACGPCNGPKNNKWALFVGRAKTPVPIAHPTKKKGDPPPVLEPPPAGMPVLLDPRNDNPLQFLALDLSGTFEFTELAPKGTREFERASYTKTILGLNRDPLPRARRASFGAYRALLKEATGAVTDAAELTRIREEITAQSHPTVWAEMQRWSDQIPELKALFAKVPAALFW